MNMFAIFFKISDFCASYLSMLISLGSLTSDEYTLLTTDTQSLCTMFFGICKQPSAVIWHFPLLGILSWIWPYSHFQLEKVGWILVWIPWSGKTGIFIWNSVTGKICEIFFWHSTDPIVLWMASIFFLLYSIRSVTLLPFGESLISCFLCRQDAFAIPVHVQNILACLTQIFFQIWRCFLLLNQFLLLYLHGPLMTSFLDSGVYKKYL